MRVPLLAPEPSATAWQVARLSTLLDRVAREVRAGRTLPTALATVAADPTVAGDALRRSLARVDRGMPVSEALDRWAEELDHRDALVVRAVLATGLTAGGALATALGRAAASLRERGALEREVRALSAQSRASAVVLSAAPVLFLLFFGVVNSAVVAAAFGSGLGRVALGVGVLLDGAGWVWMRQLEKRVLS